MTSRINSCIKYLGLLPSFSNSDLLAALNNSFAEFKSAINVSVLKKALFK